MIATRPITNGEVFIPLSFALIGGLFFAYYGIFKKRYSFGGIFLISLVVFGVLLSRIIYAVSAVNGFTPVPEGQGQPIQVSSLGPAQELPATLSDAQLESAKRAVQTDFEQRLHQKVSAKISTVRFNGKTVLKLDFMMPDGGRVTSYEGVVDGQLQRLICDYSSEYPTEQLDRSCNFKIAEIFGQAGQAHE